MRAAGQNDGWRMLWGLAFGFNRMMEMRILLPGYRQVMHSLVMRNFLDDLYGDGAAFFAKVSN